MSENYVDLLSFIIYCKTNTIQVQETRNMLFVILSGFVFLKAPFGSHSCYKESHSGLERWWKKAL